MAVIQSDHERKENLDKELKEILMNNAGESVDNVLPKIREAFAKAGWYER